MIIGRIKSKVIGGIDFSYQLFSNTSEIRLIVGVPSNRLSLFNSTDFTKNPFSYFCFSEDKIFTNERYINYV